MVQTNTNVDSKNFAIKGANTAISLLLEDHKVVTALFAKFEKIKESGSIQERGDLVEVICTELLTHATIEDELFYPAARKAIGDDDIMNEASVEHEGVTHLINELKDTNPEDEMYNAKVKVLSEYVKHHVKEE